MDKQTKEKNCKNCSQQFSIQEDDNIFYSKVSPKIKDTIFSIPNPTLCPTCRSQRRLAYRNDRSLYKTKCHKTNNSIISMYNPKNNFIVHDQKQWWGDDRDALDYGKDYDLNRSFFEQLYELKKIVPRFNLFNLDTENCEYVNYAPHCKNCYLLFGSWQNDSCFFSQTLNECKDCLDSLFLDKSELCYENIDCDNNYKTVSCQNCSNMINSYFCLDCKNCQNCIGCYNLRNKNYHIFNKPVSKEEFELEIEKISTYQYFQKLKEKCHNNIKSNAIFPAFVGFNNENVSGDFIFNSKKAKHCFSVYDSENVAFCARMFEGKNVYDFDGGGKSELLYENMSNDFSYQCIGCTTCEHLKNSYYCDLCFNSESIFGCVGLKNDKKYCILNKQYTKEEYEEILPKIIDKMIKDGEWGEFPSIEQSPFEYAETMAQEYYPLKNIHSDLIKGENKKDYIIPDNIKDVTDDICNEILSCEITGKEYKITPQELKFYKKMNIPIPRKHPNNRHCERMQLRNPRKIRDRKCDKCSRDIQTTYSPDRSETIYCEVCYNKEIY